MQQHLTMRTNACTLEQQIAYELPTINYGCYHRCDYHNQ